jgi:hypothetical protein
MITQTIQFHPLKSPPRFLTTANKTATSKKSMCTLFLDMMIRRQKFDLLFAIHPRDVNKISAGTLGPPLFVDLLLFSCAHGGGVCLLVGIGNFLDFEEITRGGLHVS